MLTMLWDTEPDIQPRLICLLCKSKQADSSHYCEIFFCLQYVLKLLIHQRTVLKEMYDLVL